MTLRGLVVIAVLAVVGIAALVVRSDDEHRKPTDATVGSHSRPNGTAAARAPTLARVPEEVWAACASLQSEKALKVRCPRRMPRGKWRVRYRSLEKPRSRYLTDLRGAADPDGAHHVLTGGRARPFSLRETSGHWPPRVPPAGTRCCARAGDLGMVGAHERGAGVYEPVRMTVIRRARVGSRRALLLHAAAHPDGGIHGDHVVVVWNQERHGYVFSIHAREPGRVTHQDQAIALAVAEEMARTP